jgi:hypothetical protein
MPIKTYPTFDQAIVDMNFALGIALTLCQAWGPPDRAAPEII